MKLPRTTILLSIMLLAFALRVTCLARNIYLHPVFFHQDLAAIDKQFSSGDRPYVNDFGYEAANVAYSLVCKGDGLANPFGGKTGSTGWVAPGIIFCFALCFLCFGCFTFYSIAFMFFISLFLSLGIVYLSYRISMLIFENQSIAYFCALLVAFCPHDIYIFNIVRLSDFNIFSFIFILIFYLFVSFYQSQRFRSLLLFASFSGIAILFNPVFSFSIVSCFLFMIFNSADNMRSSIKKAAVALIIISSIIAPYIIYQKYRLNVWTFIKSNSMYELYIGNTDDGDGELSEYIFKKYHPSLNSIEYHEYKRLGEADYIHNKFNTLWLNFSSTNFIKLSFNRFLYFFFLYPGADSQQHGWRLFIRYATYPLTGLSLLLYLIQRLKNKNSYDLLWYAYVLSFSFPFLFTGVMWRYSLPIASLTMILLGKSLAVFLTMFNKNTVSQLLII